MKYDALSLVDWIRSFANNMKNRTGPSDKGLVTSMSAPAIEAERRPGDPPVLVAGSKKISKTLGWKANYADLNTIIETAWKWHSTHPNGYEDA